MSTEQTLRSAIYVGRLTHRRREVVAHEFSSQIVMPLLFLDELDEVDRLSPLFSVGRRNLSWFRRSDYLGDPGVDLDEAVRDVVETQLARRPRGPIAQLAHVRMWGWLFNPIAIYYCFSPDMSELEALVAEVTNTPWNERHTYVLDPLINPQRFKKEMHVSPFMEMDYVYEMAWSMPDDRLSVRMTNWRGEDRAFDATLVMHRRALSAKNLSQMVLRHGLQTYRVSGGIYAHAGLLWLMRVPFQTHPDKLDRRR